MKKQQIQKQEQIEIEAVVLEEMQECLYDSLEWLEVYIGKAGYYTDWQQRKQLPKTIERENVQFMDANEVKGFFSTVLFSLSNFAKTSGVPFALERLQTQFYSWLDKSGINADNCPKELAECLINVDNVLNGKGEEFRKVRREEVRKNISQMTSEEQERKFYGAITDLQKNLKNEEVWLEAAKNKNPQDVKMENKFFGSADRGKEIFKLIKERQQSTSSSSSQSSNPQNRTNAEIIQDIRQNPRNWRLDEVITQYNTQGGAERKEMALIHSSAQIGLDGAVLGDNQPVYLAQRFDQREIAEINQALNISQQSTQTQQPSYKWSWQ